MPAYYDISVPLAESTVTWPTDPALEISKTADVCCGDNATVRQLKLGSHTGTHVDAFSHFLSDGKTLCQMELSPFFGRALVLTIQNPEVIAVEELEPHINRILMADRILFKTANSKTPWYSEPFNEQFCHLTPEAADYLIEQDVQLVGIDYLSVEGFHAKGAPTHHRLMKAGVYILEGLYLNDISPGWYDLLCLPLAIADGDGAPARAILKPLQDVKS